jgi:hypothetical protein
MYRIAGMEVRHHPNHRGREVNPPNPAVLRQRDPPVSLTIAERSAHLDEAAALVYVAPLQAK